VRGWCLSPSLQGKALRLKKHSHRDLHYLPARGLVGLKHGTLGYKICFYYTIYQCPKKKKQLVENFATNLDQESCR